MLRRTEINGKIKALENAIDQGQSREELENLVRLLMATTQSGLGLVAAGAAAAATTPLDGTHATQVEQASAQVLLLILEEQKLLRDFSDDHPDVQNVRKSIARVQQFYEARGVPLPELAGRDVPGQKTDVVGGYLQFLKQQVEELDNKDAELTRLYETESKNVKEVVKFMVEDQSRSEELERLKAQWTATVNNVSQLDMTRDNKGYTLKLLAPVREEWSVKRYLKIVGGVTACLLGLCAGLVFLREWRDMTVKSADDVRALMNGASVLGNVPLFDSRLTDFDPHVPLQPSLCYFHRPGSAEAESYRAIRTALFVGLDVAKQKIIQVSSPEPGDGKSTFVSNLAIALAQSGKKVLLLDADLRRPTVHRLFCARQEIGTAEV
ncbi:MAG TPA: P-loop NTPase, partial [Planctomycetaceae bacterium]|nr:P-loop NTPase [Planctomycetaceae bacterium]